MNKLFLLLIGVAIIFATSSCSEPSADVTVDTTTSDSKSLEGNNKGQAFVESDGFEKNVLQVALENEDFTTLVVAVQAAGVENALVNAGPLTVFAPKNSAFAKLPEGTVETLLKPENKAVLANILVNHVAPANYPIKTLKKNAKKGRQLYMASGEYVDVTVEGDDVFVNGTKILGSVKVSNGWIHIIDDCILPPAK